MISTNKAAFETRYHELHAKSHFFSPPRDCGALSHLCSRQPWRRPKGKIHTRNLHPTRSFPELVEALARRCAAPKARAPVCVTPAARTILGFGSLLSEASSRTTFPDLTNFRLVRVRGWRRVFAHAAAIFFERGIADVTRRGAPFGENTQTRDQRSAKRPFNESESLSLSRSKQREGRVCAVKGGY